MLRQRYDEVGLPCSSTEPADALWDTTEALRVDAELIRWHATPGTDAAVETKLLRALQIARAQSALSWELRVAISLARFWQRQGGGAAARGLLAATYAKVGTSDLIHARRLLTNLELERRPT